MSVIDGDRENSSRIPRKKFDFFHTDHIYDTFDVFIILTLYISLRINLAIGFISYEVAKTNTQDFIKSFSYMPRVKKDQDAPGPNLTFIKSVIKCRCARPLNSSKMSIIVYKKYIEIRQHTADVSLRQRRSTKGTPLRNLHKTVNYTI